MRNVPSPEVQYDLTVSNLQHEHSCHLPHTANIGVLCVKYLKRWDYEVPPTGMFYALLLSRIIIRV